LVPVDRLDFEGVFAGGADLDRRRVSRPIRFDTVLFICTLVLLSICVVCVYASAEEGQCSVVMQCVSLFFVR